MGLGKVHPDTVAVLFYGMGLARVDYPLSSSKGPSAVVLSQKVSGIAPMGLSMVPTAIREDVWKGIVHIAPQRLGLSIPNIQSLFQQRDTESLLQLAYEILYEALVAASPEYLDQIDKPAGYRIPGWDAKIRG